MDKEQLASVLTSYKWNNKPLEETISDILEDMSPELKKGKRITDIRDLEEGKDYILIRTAPNDKFELRHTVRYVTNNIGTGPITMFLFNINHEEITINISANLAKPEWELYEA